MIVLLRAYLAASVSRAAMSAVPVLLFPFTGEIEEINVMELPAPSL
jgi:hypothetical protein